MTPNQLMCNMHTMVIINVFPMKRQHFRENFSVIRKFAVGCLAALSLTIPWQSCFAGGSEVYASMTLGADRKCSYALNAKFPLKKGTPCTVNVSFDYSGYDGQRARGVSYWLEAAPLGSDRFRRISRTHVYDVFGKSERLKVTLPQTSRITVVFNTGGDPNFGEYYADNFTLSSREPAICRIAAPGECSFSDYDKIYRVYITEPTIYVSEK